MILGALAVVQECQSKLLAALYFLQDRKFNRNIEKMIERHKEFQSSMMDLNESLKKETP